MKGTKIYLTDREDETLKDFLNYIGSASEQTKALMIKVYRSFVNDFRQAQLRLNRARNVVEHVDGVKPHYTQIEVDNWLAQHEIKGINNNCRYFLSKFMAFMNQDHINIKKIKYRESPKNKNIPTESQLDAIFDEMKKLRYNNVDMYEAILFFKIIYYCGLRKVECLRLRPMDFLIKDGFCKILVLGKGNKQRWAILPLQVYKAVQKFIISKKALPSKRLFTTLDDKVVDQIFSTACMRAGGVGYGHPDINNDYVSTKKVKCMRMRNGELKEGVRYARRANFTIHKLRHYFATQKYKQTKDLMKVKQFLGHSSITTTQIYINPEEEKSLKEWGIMALKDSYEDYKRKYASATAEQMIKMVHPDDYIKVMADQVVKLQDMIKLENEKK